MRITTGMLNRSNGSSARSRKFLSNSAQQSKTGGAERLASMGAARASSALRRTERIGYEKLESTADQLAKSAEQMAKKADGGEDCSQEAVRLAEAYNSTLDQLDDADGVLNRYYLQMMKQVAADSKTELGEMGITVNAAGRLTVDAEKLKAADGEKRKKLLGTEGDFGKRLGTVASRVSDNATVNIQNLSTSYNARGNLTNSYLSRYHTKG